MPKRMLSNKPPLKNLPEQVKRIQQEHPEAQVELWSMDEHRIGLKPLLRRIWVRKGSRPRVTVQPRSQWLYVYGFVHPSRDEPSGCFCPQSPSP